MSRTYRRRGRRHDYDWVLRDCRWVDGTLIPFFIEARSKEGRRAMPDFTPTHGRKSRIMKRRSLRSENLSDA